MGRIRLHVTLDCSAFSLETFILANIAPSSMIASDSWRSYNFIDNIDFVYEKTKQSSSNESESLYGTHQVASLIKMLIWGTYHGRFEPRYLQRYLDEYVFRSIAESQRALVKNLCVSCSRRLNQLKLLMKKSNGILIQSQNISRLKLYG